MSFTLADYQKKSGFIPSNLMNNARLITKVVAAVYSAFPAGYFRFTSGYRNPAKNASVGGSKNSYHLKALAADLATHNRVYSRADTNKIAAIVSKFGFEVINEGDHFHIEPAPNSKINNTGFKSIGENTGLTVLAFSVFVALIIIRR